jgi:single-stranded-DNA-specific exonuclease
MLTKQKIKQILSSKIIDIPPRDIPHFNKLKNIDIATDRIIKAINNNEKIVIVGDYDVDGVVSCTIMNQFFNKIDYPVEIVIPNRFEDGYGLTPNLLNKIPKCDLIITVDNGISSYDAAILCKEMGIDLIITDHHTPTYPLPQAYTIIDPKQKGETFPFVEICGAEVVWYLCASLNKSLNKNIDMRDFLDYLVLAIIADVMPLNHINRILVKMGLARLAKSTKPFAVVLREFFNKEFFTSEDIAFLIAPRLNSAGRMDSAKLAFDFLNADITQARNLFSMLNETNEQRKEIEKNITSIAIESSNQEHFIIASGDFHEGVIGIVASRLVYHYKLPAIVFSDKGDILKGSGRSLGDVNIYELISKCKSLLEGFGGHKLACGLSIKKENLKTFIKEINYYSSLLPKEYFYLDEFILGELPLSECDFELIEILKSFEPYGEANPKPKFRAKVKIEHIRNLKDNHFKLIVSQNNIFKDGIIFRYDGEFWDRCEIVFSVEENSFNGNKNIQLMIDKILPI